MIDTTQSGQMPFDGIAVYPFQLKPVYKDYLWGGNRIALLYHRSDAPSICAESWELADRPEISNIVLNGALAGQPIRRLLTEGLAAAVYGAVERSPFFPVLCKVLDASQRLSVQVHPTSEAAKELGAEAKSEMWYVLDARPGAHLYIGFQPGVDEPALLDALKHGTIEKVLIRHDVATGDAFYIPAGTVHAVGEGCLIYEVQQNSTTTYRLFDWNRIAANGQPRALHLEQALRSIVWPQPLEPRLPGPRLVWTNYRLGAALYLILNAPFFRVERMVLNGVWPCSTAGQTPHVLFVEQGRVFLDSSNSSMSLPVGATALIPAGVREYGLAADKEPATLLRVLLPVPERDARAAGGSASAEKT